MPVPKVGGALETTPPSQERDSGKKAPEGSKAAEIAAKALALLGPAKPSAALREEITGRWRGSTSRNRGQFPERGNPANSQAGTKSSKTLESGAAKTVPKPTLFTDFQNFEETEILQRFNTLREMSQALSKVQDPSAQKVMAPRFEKAATQFLQRLKAISSEQGSSEKEGQSIDEFEQKVEEMVQGYNSKAEEFQERRDDITLLEIDCKNQEEVLDRKNQGKELIFKQLDYKDTGSGTVLLYLDSFEKRFEKVVQDFPELSRKELSGEAHKLLDDFEGILVDDPKLEKEEDGFTQFLQGKIFDKLDGLKKEYLPFEGLEEGRVQKVMDADISKAASSFEEAKQTLSQKKSSLFEERAKFDAEKVKQSTPYAQQCHDIVEAYLRDVKRPLQSPEEGSQEPIREKQASADKKRVTFADQVGKNLLDVRAPEKE